VVGQDLGPRALPAEVRDAQHEDAVEPGLLLSLGAIDDEAILASGRQEATIAALPTSALSPFLSCRSSATRIAARS
jgi:hypothetical protein